MGSFLWMGLAVAMPLGDLDWVVVNDTVMGGVSQSAVQVEETLTFSGELSLEQNGGFVSVRARAPEGAFDGATAVRLELEGDGRTYDFTLRRSDVPLRAGSYRVRVPTDARRTVVTLPLSDFRPTSFGRPVPGAPALDSHRERIATIGILLADKQPGPFELQVISMSILRGEEEEEEEGDRKPAVDGLVSAIRTGVAQFNDGDHRACAMTYASALETAVASEALTPGEVSLIEDAMDRVEEQSATEAAWTLRHAIDSVLFTGV